MRPSLRVSAIGVEPSGQADLQWNAQFFEKTNGRLGSFDPSQTKVLSLAGSHTNCALRCFGQEVAHEGDHAVCHEGHLSMELLRRRDAGFHRAALDGVVWKVLSKSVAEQLPNLLSLVHRMGNAAPVYEKAPLSVGQRELYRIPRGLLRNQEEGYHGEN